MKIRSYFLPVVCCCALFLWPQRGRALSEKGYKELRIFSNVIHYLEDNYVEQVDEEELIRGAIKGMLQTLDPHTVYMPPDIYRELKVDTRGRFDGIGIEVAIRDGALTVVSPIKGSPAEKSGVQSGDRILKINGVATETMSLTEAVSKMRGKRGSSVHLTLLRPETKKTFEAEIVRQVISVPSVKAELLDKHYGYFSITSFQQGTAKSLQKEMGRLAKQGALKGIILDLRRNPGGLLDEAVKIADLFLSEGVIVTTQSRGREIDRRVATPAPGELAAPLIVLVDGGSASASEIVAGALQDNKRGVVLGTQTFGKGSVQTVVDLEDGGGLKLTIARYFTPSGRSIQAAGITPNIVVQASAPEPEKKTARPREKDLRGHLPGEAEAALEKLTEPIADYQKQVALDYLKSWSVFQHGAPALDGPPLAPALQGPQ